MYTWPSYVINQCCFLARLETASSASGPEKHGKKSWCWQKAEKIYQPNIIHSTITFSPLCQCLSSFYFSWSADTIKHCCKYEVNSLSHPHTVQMQINKSMHKCTWRQKMVKPIHDSSSILPALANKTLRGQSLTAPCAVLSPWYWTCELHQLSVCIVSKRRWPSWFVSNFQRFLHQIISRVFSKQVVLELDGLYKYASSTIMAQLQQRRLVVAA